MGSPSPLPPHLQDCIFTSADARAAGLDKNRLRRADIAHPLRGVHRSGHTPVPQHALPPWDRARNEHLEIARAESARMAGGAVFSHITAALLLGFPLSLSRIEDSPVQVTVNNDAARRRRDGIRMHPLPRDRFRNQVRQGMPVTTPVDTWCALSALLTLDELVELGDHLVRRRHPDATMAQLERAVRRYAGRHGAKRLRSALEHVRPRTESVRETRLRLILVRAGLPEPEVNVACLDDDGGFIKTGDLVYVRERVLVEYDGEQHRTDDVQYGRDAAALERLTASGWLHVRVRKSDLHDPRAIVTRVRDALRRSVAHGSRRQDPGHSDSKYA